MTNRVQSGQRLGKYQLIKRLGAGGFAEVYLAEHFYLKQRVAIKVLTIPLDQKESANFLREAQTMASLKHPHIVGCSDFDIEGSIPFLVMDYVSGGTLRDRYPDGSIVKLSEVVNYVGQVADALQYAHDQGVMHLDVKPENMLLDANGQVLLSDFGLARFIQSVSKSKKLTSLIGTVGYMAPEFIDSTPQAATDQYALAMVAYEWLAGTLPFGGSDERAVAYQHLHTPPPSLRNSDPGIPTAVDQVICAALAKRPEDRYASVSEFAKAFAQASTLPEDEDVTYDLAPEPPETLYKEGLRARGQGKLELAEQLLSTLQSRAPAYNADIVQRQLQQIRSERRPQLLKQYRAEADAANETGAWAEEIDALQHLLQLGPEKREAQQTRTRIHLAQQHQQYDAHYQQAEDMIREGNREGARLVLKDLWEADPYYGDPAGLARKAKKISAPQTYHQVQLQRQREEARQERRDEAVDQSADRDEFREKAYGPQLHAQWLVCCCWFLLVGGLGTTVGALTQSWLVALAACIIAGALGWFLGYRKALDPIPLGITSVVGAASTLALTLALARLNYTHPISIPYTVSISTGFFTSKDVTQYRLLFLNRQLNFGLICGAITAASAMIAAMIVRPPWGKKEKIESSIYALRSFRSARKAPEPEHLTIAQLIWIVVGTWISGATLAAMIAGLAVLNEWGFGWDVGANMMLLGFLLGSTLFSGLGASLPTWWTAFKK